MRNSRLVNLAERGKIALTQLGFSSEPADVFMNHPKPDADPSFLTHASLGDIFSTGSQALEKKSLPPNVISGGCMPDAKHPKPYIKKARKEMTPAWKARVLVRLEENARNDVEPRNLAELAVLVKSDKAGMYKTFNPNARPPQRSSAYVLAICDVLGISPPLVESNENEALEKDLQIIRELDPDDRGAVMVLARRLHKK